MRRSGGVDGFELISSTLYGYGMTKVTDWAFTQRFRRGGFGGRASFAAVGCLERGQSAAPVLESLDVCRHTLPHDPSCNA